MGGYVVSGPTVQRRRLATELRRLREDADLTIERVAERLMCSPSKISRLETGRRTINPRDVRDLLDLYGVPDEDREALIDLAREARQKRGWWHAYADALPEWFETYVGLETEASSLRTFENHLMPGLLQTTEYARAVIEAVRPSVPPDEIERRVAARMTRQDILTRNNPLHLWAILDESVLRRMVGGRGVMRLQLDHLLDMGARPHVTVQVLPFEAGAHAAEASSFAMLSFPEPADPDAVYLEDLTSSLYLEKPEDLVRYTLVFDHLRGTALSDTDSAGLIRGVAKDLG